MLDATSSDLIHVSSVSFPAGEAQLSGTLFLPTSAPRAALVLNGATGVPQSYYRHFARWLAAAQGIACLTFDYTDMAVSARGHVRDSSVTMLDWMLVDQPAARAEMRRRVPNAPLWVLGHSLGALMMPMQDGIADVKRMIVVASGYAHHSDHPWPYQALARMFWFGHAPLATRILGYLPGKHLGFGADLPAGVYWQWRRWYTKRDFFWPEVGGDVPHPDWSRSGAPVRLVALEDDVMMPPHCVWRLEQAYGAEACTRVTLSPEQFGLKKIGHIGALAQASAPAWPSLLGDDAI